MEYYAEKTTRVSCIRFFPNADLRCGHLGLGEFALKKGKIDTSLLKPGEFLIFANRIQSKFKIIGPNNILIYLKSNGTERIPIRAIQLLPKLFSGEEFNFKAAAKLGFEKAA